MKEDVKELWLTDLRSGEFIQGDGQLRTLDDKNCCLGVLCERYRRETGDGQWVLNNLIILNKSTQTWVFQLTDFDPFDGEAKVYSSEYILPNKVKEWAGLNDSNPTVNLFEEEVNELNLVDNTVSLATLNDGGKPFDVIANVIEKHL